MKPTPQKIITWSSLSLTSPNLRLTTVYLPCYYSRHFLPLAATPMKHRHTATQYLKWYFIFELINICACARNFYWLKFHLAKIYLGWNFSWLKFLLVEISLGRNFSRRIVLCEPRFCFKKVYNADFEGMYILLAILLNIFYDLTMLVGCALTLTIGSYDTSVPTICVLSGLWWSLTIDAASESNWYLKSQSSHSGKIRLHFISNSESHLNWISTKVKK